MSNDDLSNRLNDTLLRNDSLNAAHGCSVRYWSCSPTGNPSPSRSSPRPRTGPSTTCGLRSPPSRTQSSTTTGASSATASRCDPHRIASPWTASSCTRGARSTRSSSPHCSGVAPRSSPRHTPAAHRYASPSTRTASRTSTPPTAVVSIVTPETRGSIRGAFCNEVHFFSTADEAAGWLEQHPGASVVPVADAHRLGRQLVEAMADADSRHCC